MPDKKYAEDNNTSTQWNLIKGFGHAVRPLKGVPTNTEAAEIILNGKLPFVVLIPEENPESDGRLQILITSGNLAGEFEFTRDVVKNNYSGMQMAIEDRNGEYSFSSFSARIISLSPIEHPLDNQIKEGNEYISERIVDTAVALLKKFVAAYREAWNLDKYSQPEAFRHLCNKSWIPEISRHLLSPWKDINIVTKEGESLFGRRVYDCRGTGIALGTVLSRFGLKQLQDYCRHEFDLGLRAYFILAERHYSNQDYEAFCIILVSTFEKEIFSLLRNKLHKQNLSDEEITGQMYSDKKRKDGTCETISVWKAINMLLNGKPYKDTNAYKNINAKLYAIRDEIVHGEPVRISQAQAELAGDSYKEFIQYIKHEL